MGATVPRFAGDDLDLMAPAADTGLSRFQRESGPEMDFSRVGLFIAHTVGSQCFAPAPRVDNGAPKAWRRYAYASLFDDDHGTAGAAVLLRAVEYCERNAANPITVADIASAARTGVRTLQRAFGTHLKMTPMEYLRQIRLHKVRADLLLIRRGHASGRVTDVALRWGFTHLGRFGQAYRRRYGETPSATVLGWPAPMRTPAGPPPTSSI